MTFLSKHISLYALGRLKWILDIIWPLNLNFKLKNQRNWVKQVWMLKFWDVINCIFVHWVKKLTLSSSCLFPQLYETEKSPANPKPPNGSHVCECFSTNDACCEVLDVYFDSCCLDWNPTPFSVNRATYHNGIIFVLKYGHTFSRYIYLEILLI